MLTSDNTAKVKINRSVVMAIIIAMISIIYIIVEVVCGVGVDTVNDAVGETTGAGVL